MELEKLTKRKIRYWLFRFKTEHSGGNSAEGYPEGLKEHFELNEDFLGWDLFNESKGWDVKTNSPLETKPLRFGSDELWNKELKKNLRELPDSEAIVVMESNKKSNRK